jgi:hypothetical protein
MNDERAPEPCMCGDCDQLRYDEVNLDGIPFASCAAYEVPLPLAGGAQTLMEWGCSVDYYRCPVCIVDSAAAREWDEMADAIAGTMLPDACRQRWIDGAVRYGQAWQSEERNNVDEAREELLDAINYFLAAGATGQLSKQHAQRFIEQTVSLLDRLYWVQAQAGRKVEEAGADG